MQSYFYDLAEWLEKRLQGAEMLTCRLKAEDSDFVRFNRAQVRQAIHVTQRDLRLHLIDGARHAAGWLTLAGDAELDRARAGALVDSLRSKLPHLLDDPYLLFNTAPTVTERVAPSQLPPAAEAVGDVLAAGQGTDLVGIYAAGGIYDGFTSSLGQRNWFATWSHNLDWSLYHVQDKAVKANYAGFTWERARLQERMEASREQLRILQKTPRTIDPGHYRVYLSPSALLQLINMLSWTGFGLKDHRTRQTCLIRMVEEGARLHPGVHLTENTREGVAADFQEDGFIKPDAVPLIQAGAFGECLASPRSAREYGVATNGASADEAPASVDMAPGTLAQADALRELGTGVYVNNLWYLNYSDRNACRITGMTRFASFWVENGQIVAPVNVMRFDETIYHVLGDRLAGLTREREMLVDPHSYEHRSTDSARLPGALVDGLAFTL